MASSSSLAATAAALSWSSSISLGNFGFTLNGTAKISNRRGRFVIVANKKVKKFRQVILKEDVEHVGTKGKLCRVRAGFMRNYLLPLGLAQTATPDLLKEIRLEEERIEAEKQRVKEEAKQLALIFETAGAFKVKRKGGKGKQIFGTVTSQDLVDIIKSQLQRDVDKRIVTIPEIREVGSYIAELKLHPEVTALVRVNVSAI